jgi:hypothetical protein
VFLVGDIVTGDVVSAGTVAHVPSGPEVFQALPIRSVEFVDHVAEKTSELALYVVGDTSEQMQALDTLEGAQLIEITERDA